MTQEMAGTDTPEEGGPIKETASERQCVACRKREHPSRLLRFAAGPKSVLVVDGYRRLPGRGAHACPSPDCIRIGLEKGSFSRTLKEPVKGNAQELCLAAAEILDEKALQRLGIGRRNGSTHYGMDDVLRTIAVQQAAIIVVASDASERTRDDVKRAAQLQNLPVLTGPSMEKLGGVLGRGEVAVVALSGGPAADDVLWLMQGAARLRSPPGERAKRRAPTVETGEGEA